MPNITDLLVVMGMVALRFGVPTLVLAALVYGLKRLDRRWEAEARDYAAKHPEARIPVQPLVPARPAVPARQPAPSKMPELPFVIPPAAKEQRVQPGLAMTAQPACWDVKGCSNDAKSQCAAPAHPDQPCWQARFDAEGQIPEECVRCDVFQRYPMM
jgi:hypothetical protein